MATVIDALVVTLGLDNSQFKKGTADTQKDLKTTRESTDKTARDMEQAGKKAAEFYKQVRNSALQFFGVLTAGRGMADFTADTINQNAQLNRLATNLGMSAAEISAWGRAVEQSGGNANAFMGTLSGISQQITNFAVSGDPGNLFIFGKLGVALADAAGKARPVLSILKDVNKEIYARVQSGAVSRTDAFNILGQMGIDEGTRNLMLQAPDAVQKLIDTQKAQAAVTDQNAARMQRLQELWIAFKQKLDAVARAILDDLIPSLEWLMDQLQPVADWLINNKEIAIAFFTGLTGAAIAAAAPLFALAAPLLLIGAKIAALSVVIGLLWDDWQAFTKGGKSELEGLWKIVSVDGPEAWETLKKGILGAWDVAKKELAFFVALFTGNSKDIEKASKDLTDSIQGQFKELFDWLKGGWDSLIEYFTSGKTPAIVEWFKGRWNALTGQDNAIVPSAPEAPESDTSGGSILRKGIDIINKRVLQFKEDFEQQAKAFGVDQAVLMAQINQESRGNVQAYNVRTGAAGIAQFMKPTAEQYGISNRYDPHQSIKGQANYMSDLLKTFGGDMKKALAGYNWGQGNLQKAIAKYGEDWLSHAPKETRDYVTQIMSTAQALKSEPEKTPKIASAYTAGDVAKMQYGNTTNNNQANKTTSINTGNIIINTPATDARGIARDLRGELAAQGDYGLI